MGRSMKSPSSANSAISSYFSASCSRVSPAASPPRTTFSRPVSSAVEADAEREQRAHAAVHLDPSLGRRQDSRDGAHESRLAGAVASR